MAIEPKELMADWMRTFDREKMLPCRPAGRPIFRISRTLSETRRTFLNLRRTAPWERESAVRVRAAEMPCAIAVASATPAAPMRNLITNSRFISTLAAPAMDRKYSGRRVSPVARRIAAAKL